MNETNNITVEIPKDLSCFVEEKQYIYNNMLNLIKFLNFYRENNQNIIEKYEEKLQQSFNELEIAKNQIVNTFLPKELCKKKYKYSFDFYNYCIDFLLEE